MSMEVANTILATLGGNKFRAMTGAKSFSGESNSLIFKLPTRFAKDGITAVKVTLEPSDTYTMTFYKQARAPSFAVTVVAEVSDVYADSIRSVFTAKTGLETSLGTMGKVG